MGLFAVIKVIPLTFLPEGPVFLGFGGVGVVKGIKGISFSIYGNVTLLIPLNSWQAP